MRFGMWKSFVATSVLLAQGTWPMAECQAGPIIDWLFHRNDVPYAQPIYGPPVVAQPAAVPAPTVSACPPCNQCQRATTYYAPEPYYRTTWTRMPVTNYRPVVAASPVAGYPVTTMQPCNTYIWQARRVPSYGLFGPTYSGYAPAVSSGCPSCGATAATPYYSPAAPSSLGPAVSPRVVMPGASSPGVNVPGPASSPAVVPADVPPSLSPGGLPPATIRNFAPLDSVTPPIESEGPSLDPSGDVPLNSPAATQKKPAKNDRLRLVPDPDVPSGVQEPNRAPRLLTPREKTAAKSLRHDWAATLIPSSEAAAVRPASVESSVPAGRPAKSPAEEKWDDTGWRSLRP